MQIAIISHNFGKGGGQARVNYELVRHCLAKRYTVHVVSQHLAPELRTQGALWHAISPSIPKPQLLSDWSFSLAADRFIGELRPHVDLIVGNGFVTRQPHDISVCHMLHSAFYKSPFFPWRSWTRSGPKSWYHAAFTKANSRWEQQSYAAADVVVAVSNKVRRELIDIGLAPRKVRVIHNGVDLKEFRPGHADRKTWNLPENTPLALFAGGIRNTLRNLDSVLKALVSVPQLHLAVAGDPTSSPYPAMAEKLGLGDRVHFVGFRTDIPDLMRAADFFVYPSRYEACSLVLLEAMSSGLPIITAVSAGGSELLDDSCGWVLQDPHDVKELVTRMRILTEDRDLRAKLSSGARATAESYSWGRMADEYVRLFEERVAASRSEHARDDSRVPYREVLQSQPVGLDVQS